jgi:hypothetical protein
LEPWRNRGIWCHLLHFFDLTDVDFGF